MCSAPHWRHAALIIIEKGALHVDAVANEPTTNTRASGPEWDGYVEMDSSLYVALSTGRLSPVGMMKEWRDGNIKAKGILKLIILWDVFRLLKKMRENRTKTAGTGRDHISAAQAESPLDL